MCRGLALGFNGKDIICKGLSSHRNTLGNKEDEYFKLEIIIDDSKEASYAIEADEQYYYNGILDEKVKTQFEGFFKKDGKVQAWVIKDVEKWALENETQVLRWLLANRTYARAGGDQHTCFCKAGGDQNMSYCKAGGDQHTCFCEAGGDQDMSGCRAGGDQDMSGCRAGGDQDMSYCEARGDQDMSYCEARGDQDMSYCACGGERYIGYMSGKDIKINEFIKKLSDKHHGMLTFDALVHLAMDKVTH